MATSILKTALVQLTLAAATLAGGETAQAHGDVPASDFNLHKLLADVRKATAPFNEINAALAANYVKFPDLEGDCVAQPGQGGMGIHYLNASLLDAKLDPLRPEMLVYRKNQHGKHELVALEYVVFAPVWDALHPQPPVLFGHPFHLVRTPNRYGTSMPLYELHVWLWEHNPNGLFNDWNPSVSCN
ncbi:MAG TPA: hypothetical protein VFL64_19220 [Rhizobacter sp.]|nr:hypothetical protein [Rhizobacter sp.]